VSVLSGIVESLPIPLRNRAFLWRDRAYLISESFQDYTRYRRFSGAPDKAALLNTRGRNAEAQLTKDYHRIEKGLSFRAPRRPFGNAVSGRLDSLLPVAETSTELRLNSVQAPARTALHALRRWNDSGDVDANISPVGDYRSVLSVDEAEQFFLSRHSLRNFDKSIPVPEELLAKALEFVSHTPSVCNRQGGNIHLYTDPEQIAKILRLQAGSAGFSDTIGNLAVVSVESGLFTGVGERNQPWIDGSLAAMTFVWGLHSLGIHSCMLNWSKRNRHSRRLRELGDIPASEDIICLVAFGFPPADGYRVARSPRRSVSDFSTRH
jgi:nitroreductase